MRWRIRPRLHRPRPRTNVAALPHEGGGHKVDAVRQAKVHEVVLILLRHRGQVHDRARQVHVLALAEDGVVEDLDPDRAAARAVSCQRSGRGRPAGRRRAIDAPLLARLNPQRHVAVRGEDDHPGLHSGWERLVRAGDHRLVAQRLAESRVTTA